MPTIRIIRGSFRQSSGERAEPGDVIDVDESTLERLNAPSYELVEDEAEDDGVPEPTTSQDVGDDDLPSPEDKEDENVETPEPVRTGDEDEADVESADAEDEDEAEDKEQPSGADSNDIGDTEPTPDVPDDYSLLSKMAKLYEGDEVHGAMSGDEITGFLESLSPTEVNGLKRRAKQEMEG